MWLDVPSPAPFATPQQNIRQYSTLFGKHCFGNAVLETLFWKRCFGNAVVDVARATAAR